MTGKAAGYGLHEVQGDSLYRTIWLVDRRFRFDHHCLPGYLTNLLGVVASWSGSELESAGDRESL